MILIDGSARRSMDKLSFVDVIMKVEDAVLNMTSPFSSAVQSFVAAENWAK